MILLALLALLSLAQQPSGAIQGLISRAGTNQPLARATVEIRGDDDAALPLHTTTTESDGRFLIPNIRPGRYRVMVSSARLRAPDAQRHRGQPDGPRRCRHR